MSEKGFHLSGWHTLSTCGLRWEEGSTRWAKKSSYGVWFILQVADMRHMQEHHGLARASNSPRYRAAVSAVDLQNFPRERLASLVRLASGRAIQLDGGHLVSAGGERVCDKDGGCVADAYLAELLFLSNRGVCELKEFVGKTPGPTRSRAKAFAARLMLRQPDREEWAKYSPDEESESPGPASEEAPPVPLLVVLTRDELYLLSRGWELVRSGPLLDKRPRTVA